MDADITFITDDDPEANGRIPYPNEQRYTLFFTLEDKRILSIHMGQHSYNTFKNLIAQMSIDDALQDALGD